MTLPAGVVTAHLTFAPPTDDTGDLVEKGRVTLLASTDRVWEATGELILKRNVVVKLDGAPQVIPFAATDQPGMVNGAGEPIIDWTIDAVIDYGNGRPRQLVTFALPTGGVDGLVVDFWRLVPVEQSDGSTIAVTTVTSVGGLVGPVVADQLAGKLNRVDLRAYLEPFELFPNDGIADAAPLFRRAVDAIGAAAGIMGPTAISVPAGRYRIDSTIYWKSGVGVIGQGYGNTVIAPTGQVVFGAQSGTTFAQIGWFDDVVFADLTIDCTAQTGPANQVGIKGVALRYLRDSRFENVWIINSWATSFGCDYLQETKFINCVAINAGRGVNVGSWSFGSGFGIGVGEFANESVAILGCTSLGAQSAGVFIERLPIIDTPAEGNGFIVANFTARGNYNGALLAGGHNVQILGGDYSENVFSGIAFNGPNGGRTGDKGALITGVKVRGNGTSGEAGCGGIVLRHAGEGGSTIADSDIIGNTGPGIYAPATAQLGPGWAFNDLRVEGNTGGGIILDNNLCVGVRMAGGVVRSNGDGDGIRLSGDLVEPVIRNMVVQGHTGWGINLPGPTLTCARPWIEGNVVSENRAGGLQNLKDTPDTSRILSNWSGPALSTANQTEHPTNAGSVAHVVVESGFTVASVAGACPSGSGTFIRGTATANGSITLRPDKKSDAALSTKTVTYSCWLRVSNPLAVIRVGGTAYYGAGTDQRTWMNGGVRPTLDWQRVSITIPMPTTGKRANLVIALDSATIGDTLDVDAIALTEGTCLWPWTA
jgi:hypothetical protein